MRTAARLCCEILHGLCEDTKCNNYDCALESTDKDPKFLLLEKKQVSLRT